MRPFVLSSHSEQLQTVVPLVLVPRVLSADLGCAQTHTDTSDLRIRFERAKLSVCENLSSQLVGEAIKINLVEAKQGLASVRE